MVEDDPELHITMWKKWTDVTPWRVLHPWKWDLKQSSSGDGIQLRGWLAYGAWVSPQQAEKGGLGEQQGAGEEAKRSALRSRSRRTPPPYTVYKENPNLIVRALKRGRTLRLHPREVRAVV